MRKGSLERKALKEGREIYDLFQDGLELDKLESDKLTTSYNDEGFTMDVTDYLGETSTVTERSCVTLVDVGFKMNIEETYLQYYEYYTKRDELIVGERF